MKTVEIEMPDRMIAAASDYVAAGFFRTEADVIRAAVADFVRRNRVDLLEQFAREDIEWARNETRRPA